MKKVLLLGLSLLLAAHIAAEVNPKPFVIPELTAWTGAEGRFTPSGRVIVNDKAIRPAAEAFADDYRTMFHRPLEITKGRAKAGDFVFVWDKSLPEEAYTMEVAGTTTICASTLQGFRWAAQTLLQLSEQAADRSLPRGKAADVPQYKLRGLMLDCGRKYIPLRYIRELLKTMSYYKMNALQLHLNDNGFPQYFENDWEKTQAAFRLESDTYPGLTARDGAYTKAEFIALQEAAERLGVEIIPEIDVPAHSLAFTNYKPELGSRDYGADHLDIHNPETQRFVDNLFKEYLAGKNPVFRGKRVNIGTDEYSNKDKAVVEAFRAFTDRYLSLVKQYGKQPACWGSLSHAQGETPVQVEGVLMFCWSNDYAKPQEMKALGYQLVSIPDGYVYIVPAAGYYYDYLNCQMLYETWTPARMGNVQFEENDPQVEGGMFAVWNDHVGNGISVADIHHRVFPALQTMATKCWTGKKTSLPYADFDRLRHQLSEGPGVNELGRLKEKANLPELPAGRLLRETLTEEHNRPALPDLAQLPDELGWPYRISFRIDCAEEARGTVLFQGTDATFYLSDPQQGRLGFARDGYLNTFNYRLPTSGSHLVTIEGTNTCTRLFIDGKLREELKPLKVYAMNDAERIRFQPDAPFVPAVYAPTWRNTMQYVRTLRFPLRETGAFRSRITGFEAEQTEE
ncbi:MAG: family 20 glycosylhydrolase [Alloprevotella sp.]|nr:family 20 glycosylhydrolase [Alloprevotella sp.]